MVTFSLFIISIGVSVYSLTLSKVILKIDKKWKNIY